MQQRERQWLADYRRGDVEALGYLVETYRRPLYAFILRHTQRSADPEEIFQEVWRRAIAGLDGFRGTRLLSWLFRIAHNLIIDRARRAARSPVEPLTSEAQAAWLEASQADPRRNPGKEHADAELGHRVLDLVKKLPPEQREVFEMRMEGDIPFREIARIQGVSINTALARMRYAVAHIRKELQDTDRELAGESG